jgi:hypothetical protein
MPGQLNANEEKRFEELLSEFILTYAFPLKAPVKFSQCSPFTYLPPGNK